MKSIYSIILFFLFVEEIINKSLTHIRKGKSKHSKQYGGAMKYMKPRVTPSAHYEKIIQKNEKYIWVNGDKPSGLPGSYVVSAKEATGHGASR